MKFFNGFTTSHFIHGAASVISIMPMKRNVKKIKKPQLSDYNAIKSDWTMIGNDLMTAFQKGKMEYARR